MTRTVPLYQVDAFADAAFGGNPAAVCPLDAWLPDGVMQAVAAENNLSETAFFAPDADGDADYHLRWFTPTVEVDLCGHATLAGAWVLFNERGFSGEAVRFATRSGMLTVARGDDGELIMDFPAQTFSPAPHPDDLAKALGRPAREYWRASNDMRMAVLDDADAVRALRPNLAAVARLGGMGLIVTAPGGGTGDSAGDGAGDGDRDGDGVDFVSRFFAPLMGIAEDPVTGAAHTVLAPYWAKRLGRADLAARQCSPRGGAVACVVDGPRVRLAGRAVLFFKGEAYVPGA